MRIVKFYENVGSLKLRVDTLEDLWTAQRIIFANDIVKSESERKFRSSESDKGELKKVVITLRVEKTELDKDAGRLRILGKILEGKPLEYVKINSYHTLNIAPGDVFEILKGEWHNYIMDVVRNAVSDSKRPRLGIIVLDDEKALPAYLLGYGLEFRNEIYSRLSKRMSPKDFNDQQRKYYEDIIEMARGMVVDTVVIAGPGFTKDDVKAYGESNGMLKKIGKRLFFESISNSERSGVYELIKSDRFARILERERIRDEFKLIEEFLVNLSTGKSKYGLDNVSIALDNMEANTVFVNDNMLGDSAVQQLLAKAEEGHVRIEVFNSSDEVGMQLHSFKDIACI
ncbi:MAG: mRNA surveillance protein pelota [Candidatus Micrarchaeota archaeon]|nr:mRNA surveillance protein pelota [Candidatus Micrarchaeota archaeon]